MGGVFVHWVGGGADPPRKAPILREVAGSRTYPTRKAALAGVYALRVHRGCALPLTLSPVGVAHISHPAPRGRVCYQCRVSVPGEGPVNTGGGSVQCPARGRRDRRTDSLESE